MDTVLDVQKGTIDISLLVRKIDDYTEQEILKQEKGAEHGQAR